MGELGANATHKQAGQAVAVDDGNAGGCYPSDETESNDGQIRSQPVPLEAASTHPRLAYSEVLIP